jgi:hypothetical protein
MLIIMTYQNSTDTIQVSFNIGATSQNKHAGCRWFNGKVWSDWFDLG